ncbi:ATP-dependent nuclease [Paractinoplanes atraurantiacus]|uniref:AAA domain-containing protein n=1 Tax=Paractinoplanes atraurantiacus TaxID=1036182 RepID=A0A285KD19_9ACTN|nr:AAA family ATPase [Actinoplanes atraurantiacus]SNY69211.1 AAA domain-containing protein [Actinoplanes atraurantiacus]
MRLAERAARLQKLRRRNYSTTLTTAKLDVTMNDGSIANLELDFSPGMSIVSGGNGAGKSTLLGAIWRCLSASDPEPGSRIPGSPKWLHGIQITGQHNSNEWVATFDAVTGTKSSSLLSTVTFIDPAAETEEILRQFRLDQASDVLEGVDPASFDRAQLESLSYVLRRSYSEFLVYEVTAFSSDDSALPFFEATSMGKQYSLLEMGRGELVAAYLLWRLREQPAGSVVLIEEPESHLAAFSQDNLVDAIVAMAVERDLCLIVSSHSPGFFQKLPPEHVMLVSSLPNPAIRTNLSASELASHLGVAPHTAAVVLVEDPVAAELLHAVLSSVDREALRHLDIRPVRSGESGVQRIIKDVNAGLDDSVELLGVLDGDQRQPGVTTLQGPIGFLIGNDPPEVLLRDLLTEWRSGKHSDWQPRLPGGEEALRMSLERLDGRDLHDWIQELAIDFGGLRAVVRAAVELALRIEPYQAQAQDLVAWIRRSGRLR